MSWIKVFSEWKSFFLKVLEIIVGLRPCRRPPYMQELTNLQCCQLWAISVRCLNWDIMWVSLCWESSDYYHRQECSLFDRSETYPIARNVGVQFVQGDPFVLAGGYVEALMHGRMRRTFSSDVFQALKYLKWPSEAKPIVNLLKLIGSSWKLSKSLRHMSFLLKSLSNRWYIWKFDFSSKKKVY